MKAIVITEFGDIDQLQLKEIDKPVVKADRMIVEVYATSVNPVDVKRRKGLFGGKLPMIVGNDVAGIVTEVGEDVTDFKVGDRVMANGSKTYAEFVLVNPERTVRLDDSVTFAEAAALPLVGQTAYQALITQGEVKEGDRVLIHAGSGGVGTTAIQIAKHLGARVASTASGKNQELLKSLGVDRPVNYEKEAFDEVLSDIDFVFDTMGGSVQEKSYNVLRPNGKLISIAEEPNELVSDTKAVEASFFSMNPTKEALEILNKWLSQGIISPVISEIAPFSEEGIREAHALSESGHTKGKIIIKLKSE